MPVLLVRVENILAQVLRIAKPFFKNKGAGVQSFIETRNNANSIAW